uniref:LPXTG cell wall anchor domain-containing protein n=1 Tax=Angiostrongylus cantonensis TaxID=6313 RepID=A0A0K0CY43_ANGCA
MPVTIIVIGLVSIIAVVAVGLFMKKKRKIATEEEGRAKKMSKMEDGMVEIELDSNNLTKK